MLKFIGLPKSSHARKKNYNDIFNQHSNLRNLRTLINYITMTILNFINFTGNDNIY